MINAFKELTSKEIYGVDKEVWEMLKDLDKITTIGEEQEVIKRLLRGEPKAHIIKYLKEKYPQMSFRDEDINGFMRVYRNIIIDEKSSIERRYRRKLMRTKIGLNNQLIDLAMKASTLINKCEDEKDNTNAIAALRVASDIFMKVAKLEGMLEENKPEVNVSINMDKVVSELTTGDSEFKNAVMKVLSESKDGPVLDANFRDITDEN